MSRTLHLHDSITWQVSNDSQYLSIPNTRFYIVSMRVGLRSFIDSRVDRINLIYGQHLKKERV